MNDLIHEIRGLILLPQNQKGQTVSDQLLKSATRSRKSGAIEISQTPSGGFVLRRNANIHAKEYQLYLPDKELLRRKLAEWGEEVGG